MIQASLTIILIGILMRTEKIFTLSLKEISRFPHPVKLPFYLQILPETDNIKLNNFTTETMLITIRDKTGFIVEKHIFNYGYQYSIDDELIGNFIDIPIWQRDIDSTIINITIIFKRESNSKLIEIFHLPANTTETRKKMFRNLKIANLIYSSKINLLIPSKLVLFVKPINQSNDELLFHNEIAIAICRAYDGVPKEKPIFTNHQKFNVTKSEYNIQRNERKLWFNVSIFDHRKNLTCRAGYIYRSFTINVLQNMIQSNENKILTGNQYSMSNMKSIDYDKYDKEINLLKKNSSFIGKSVKILFDNQSLMENITQIKIDLLNKSINGLNRKHNQNLNSLQNIIDEMKIENKLFKQRKNEEIDILKAKVENLIKDMINDNKKKYRTNNDSPTVVNNQNKQIKYQHQFNWTVNGIHEIIKRNKYSKIFHKNLENIDYNFCIDTFYIQCWYQTDNLRFNLFIKMKTISNESRWLNATIVIVNKEEGNYFQTNSRVIEIKNNCARSRYIIFDNLILSKYGILKSDTIVIKCFLSWIK